MGPTVRTASWPPECLLRRPHRRRLSAEPVLTRVECGAGLQACLLEPFAGLKLSHMSDAVTTEVRTEATVSVPLGTRGACGCATDAAASGAPWLRFAGCARV